MSSSSSVHDHKNSHTPPARRSSFTKKDLVFCLVSRKTGCQEYKENDNLIDTFSWPQEPSSPTSDCSQPPAQWSRKDGFERLVDKHIFKAKQLRSAQWYSKHDRKLEAKAALQFGNEPSEIYFKRLTRSSLKLENRPAMAPVAPVTPVARVTATENMARCKKAFKGIPIDSSVVSM